LKDKSIKIKKSATLRVSNMNSALGFVTREKRQILDVVEKTIQTIEEYETPYGPVDIVAITKETHHIIEIKRAKAQISACTQLLRYLEYFHEKQIKTKDLI
jgi:RecB family endonuclease NucS